MRRTLNRLTVRQVETLKVPGRHADGGNLYLSISPVGTRRWMFMYSAHGKQREMGLGSAAKGEVPLAMARARAAEARALLAAGIDPIAAKQEAARKVRVAQAPIFGTMADDYLAAMRPSWRNDKHADQWTYTLKELAAPLRSKRVNQIPSATVCLASSLNTPNLYHDYRFQLGSTEQCSASLRHLLTRKDFLSEMRVINATW